jgi:hypothetical protein
MLSELSTILASVVAGGEGAGRFPFSGKVGEEVVDVAEAVLNRHVRNIHHPTC